MLPPSVDLETKEILKQLSKANRALAELKGYADTIPNKHILINAVLINEAKDSSEIENIITTHDDLFKAMSGAVGASAAAKEVENYRTALWFGYEFVNAKQVLTTNLIAEIQGLIEKNNAGIRKLPGTVLRNVATGETIYTPPEGESVLIDLLFYEFYTKIKYVEKGLSVSRKTAASYLESLEDLGILSSEKIGKERIYKNKRLYELVNLRWQSTLAKDSEIR